MKISLFTLLALLFSLTVLGCNSAKSKSLNTDAHQQANNTRSFPTAKRPNSEVSCRNCYATFKLSRATQKQAHGHSYTACPVCHHDYLKKAK